MAAKPHPSRDLHCEVWDHEQSCTTRCSDRALQLISEVAVSNFINNQNKQRSSNANHREPSQRMCNKMMLIPKFQPGASKQSAC
eukprot:9588627-Prorocentrum_lima.AAC.1